MKFYLVEDTKVTELSGDDKEFHFYGSPKTGLYYYNGSKLIKIPKAIAKKLAGKKDEFDFPGDESPEDRKVRIKSILNDFTSGDLADEMETDSIFFGDTEAGKHTKTGKVIPPSKRQLLEDSIRDFISWQVGIKMDYGYGKDNPMSVDPRMMKKVRKHKHIESDEKPIINVYFDRSGSWSGTYFDNFAEDILNILAEFAEEDLIEEPNVYYFAVHVWSDEETALAEGNNSGEPIIRHMIETKPDNVIIMTDSHISHPDDQRWETAKCTGHSVSYMKSKYVAPGAVWAIFVGGEAETLVKGYGDAEWHLAGEELTKVFTFSRGE